MPYGWTDNSSTIVSNLIMLSSNCRARIEQTEANNKKKEQIKCNIDQYNAALEVLESSKNLLRATLKECEEFATEKKEKALASINLSIYRCSQIIQCSRPIHLEYEPGKALFTNDLGMDVNLLEGGALRAILSFLLRHTVLQCTNNIQTIFSDEGLAVLNDERSADFSSYLPLLAKTCQILLIEQKDEIFSNTNETSYFFKLEDGVSHIRKGTTNA